MQIEIQPLQIEIQPLQIEIQPLQIEIQHLLPVSAILVGKLTPIDILILPLTLSCCRAVWVIKFVRK